MKKLKQGKLYGVGVGPGDPELLTLKALRILQQVSVVFIPKSSPEKRSLALSIVSDVLNGEQKQEELILPMTRDHSELEKYWQIAAEQIFNYINAGYECAFVTLGDPGTYSTFSYLKRYLQAMDGNIQIEQIPGISAINALSANSGEPLAEGEESLLIANALKPREEMAELLDRYENLVLLKAGRSAGEIAGLLKEKNFRGQIVFASRIGFDDAFYTTNLNEIENEGHDYLSTFFIKNNGGGFK